MKKILSKVAILFLGLLFFYSCKENTKGIKINVSGLNSPSKTLYFYNYDSKIDSLVIVKNGLIEFQPTWKESQVIFIYDTNNKIEFLYEKNNINLDIILENEIVDMKKSTINYISETTNNKAFKHYSSTLQDFIKRDKKLSNEWQYFLKKYTTSEELSKHRKPKDDEFALLTKDKKTFFVDYVSNNINAISQYIMLKDLSFYYDVKSLEKILNNTPEINRGFYYQELKEKLTITKKLEIGSIAPNIRSNSIEGNEICLYSTRGDYVLVDFWASWCTSCRKENPWVKKAYDSYKEKGFKVYSVSLDYPGQREAWLKAIEIDQMNEFINVSLLKGWRDPVAKYYNLSGIPSPYLLDPNGKILAKGDDLREEGLLNNLKKYLK